MAGPPEGHPERMGDMAWGTASETGESGVPEPCWIDGCSQTQDSSGCPTHGIS